MVLYYYKGNNFGDSLNPFIFQRLLPGFFDHNEAELFVGFGSLLGFRDILKARKKIIFSTGFARGKTSEYGSKPKIDRSFDIRCVRGPLTARELGLDQKLALTDGAALIRTLGLPQPEKSDKLLFMPHKSTAYKFDWEPVCRQADIDFASPHDGIGSVIDRIRAARLVLAESLHAAIVADAFRVPWLPVKTFYSINRFKWLDWTASLEMPYKPVRLLPLFSETRLEELIRRSTPFIINETAASFSKGYGWLQNKVILDKTLRKLDKLKQMQGFLSKERVLDEKVERLIVGIEELKKQAGSG